MHCQTGRQRGQVLIYNKTCFYGYNQPVPSRLVGNEGEEYSICLVVLTMKCVYVYIYIYIMRTPVHDFFCVDVKLPPKICVFIKIKL